MMGDDNSNAAATERSGSSGGGRGATGASCGGDSLPGSADQPHTEAAPGGDGRPRKARRPPLKRGRPAAALIAQLEHLHTACAASCAALEAENRQLAAKSVALEAWTSTLALLVSVTAPLRRAAADELMSAQPGVADDPAAALEVAVRSFQAWLDAVKRPGGVDCGGAATRPSAAAPSGAVGGPRMVPWFDILREWAADEDGLRARVRHAGSSPLFLPQYLGDYVRSTSLDLCQLRAAQDAGDPSTAAAARTRVDAALHSCLANRVLALVADLRTMWQTALLRLDTLEPWDQPGGGGGGGAYGSSGGSPAPPEAAAAAWIRAARLDARQVMCLGVLMAQWREVAHSPWHARRAAVAAAAQQLERLDELDAQRAQLAVANATFSWLNAAFQIAAFTVIMRPDQAASAVVAAYPNVLTMLAVDHGVHVICASPSSPAAAAEAAAGAAVPNDGAP